METIEAYAIPGFREPFSCFSHLFAAPVFALFGYFLILRGRGNPWRVLSLSILAVASVLLLSISGVYHLLEQGTARAVMNQLDVAGVFTLIAGTATPVHGLAFRGLQRWAPIVIAWTAALAGITLRITFWGTLPTSIGIIAFVLMGWGGLFSLWLLWSRHGYSFVKPLLWGGIAYTVGALIMGFHWPNLVPGIVGPHEIWHVAVLIGLGLHWRFVFEFADGTLCQ